MSQATFMAQKLKIGSKTTTTNADPGYIISDHNSPADCARELFIPSKTREVL